ncbi:MAG: 5-methyltetrahydropteroyltriglutamate--homocysteine methyltransferase [Cellvibrionaceae bacterium]|jgi:5-methyltetrahydropteroyltriglutamate--homocysteine methyltransferase
MKKILTTHVGSMPRPQEVVDMLFAEDRDELSAEQRTEYDAIMQHNVADTVQKQVNSGVDIPSDGEMSKISYATYIRHRLTGFEISDTPPPRATPKDLDDYPEYKQSLAAAGGTPKYHRPVCVSPITIKDMTPLEKDIANMKGAMKAAGTDRGFMNAASPGVIAVFQPNNYYSSHQSFLAALAEVMKVEFEMIHAAGLTLQVDCPDLAMGRHIKFRDDSDDEFVRNAEMQVEALNHALQNIPAEDVRMHLCWGNYEGPHNHDIALQKIMDTVFKINCQGLQFEASNPRHAHEWEVWAAADIPEDKVLIPGVIDTTTNFVEHPELVSQRILNFTNIVGRDRVIAGTDCGFGTFAGFGAVHPSICWAKLEALAQGAALASAKLW